MMSDHSPSMGDEVFMTRKSESGKTKNVDLRETTKSGFSAFWKQALHIVPCFAYLNPLIQLCK